MAAEAQKISNIAAENKCEIILPVDLVTVETLAENAPSQLSPVAILPLEKSAVDIGPATVKLLAEKLASCKTILWNGPLGVFEVTPFDEGTNAVAKLVGDLTQQGKLVSVAGGGDTVSALEHAGVADQFSYISTAGGAFLEWMEGKTLPGVAALLQNKKAA
jgi:phosphoglycerate kinase